MAVSAGAYAQQGGGGGGGGGFGAPGGGYGGAPPYGGGYPQAAPYAQVKQSVHVIILAHPWGSRRDVTFKLAPSRRTMRWTISNLCMLYQGL